MTILVNLLWRLSALVRLKIAHRSWAMIGVGSRLRLRRLRVGALLSQVELHVRVHGGTRVIWQAVDAGETRLLL